MDDLKKATEDYRFALLELSAIAGKAAREIENGKHVDTPYVYGIVEANTKLWNAYKEVKIVYQKINSYKKDRR